MNDPQGIKPTSHRNPLRLYAHWLDGEWFKVAYPVTVEGYGRTLEGLAESAMKLHALIGTRIAISDVQLTDSQVMVNLFGNPEFRDYLKCDPKFLTLVTHPWKGSTEIRVNRFFRATSGLNRAKTTKDWTTSLPNTPVSVIREFAAAVLTDDKEKIENLAHGRCEDANLVIQNHPEHRGDLEGILYGIRHFTKVTGGPTDEPALKSPGSYVKALENAIQKGADSGSLEGVWKSIKHLVPDEESRWGRSSLARAMEAKRPDRAKWPDDWHRAWNTVVHVWNSNVCSTVGAQESIAPLPEAVVPIRGEITDVGVPFRSESGLVRNRAIRKLPILHFDPCTLDWSDVTKAVGDERVSARQRDFQRALKKGDAKEKSECGKELSRALIDTLIPRHRPLSEWAWSLARWVPEVLELSRHGDLRGGVIATTGETIWFLRDKVRAGILLNTLSGFEKDLITIFDTSKKAK